MEYNKSSAKREIYSIEYIYKTKKLYKISNLRIYFRKLVKEQIKSNKQKKYYSGNQCHQKQEINRKRKRSLKLIKFYDRVR